jgi:hypothetical protein
MGRILCATRGGEASPHTQDAAIAKAKEASDELVFLYIYGVKFLGHAKYTLRSDVVMEELDRMAEFLMAMAIERAKQQGVRARYVVAPWLSQRRTGFRGEGRTGNPARAGPAGRGRQPL